MISYGAIFFSVGSHFLKVFFKQHQKKIPYSDSDNKAQYFFYWFILYARPNILFSIENTGKGIFRIEFFVTNLQIEIKKNPFFMQFLDYNKENAKYLASKMSSFRLILQTVYKLPLIYKCQKIIINQTFSMGFEKKKIVIMKKERCLKIKLQNPHAKVFIKKTWFTIIKFNVCLKLFEEL